MASIKEANTQSILGKACKVEKWALLLPPSCMLLQNKKSLAAFPPDTLLLQLVQQAAGFYIMSEGLLSAHVCVCSIEEKKILEDAVT